MAEYIEREDTINSKPEGRNPQQFGKEEYNKGWNDCRRYFVQIIESQTAADVAPVVHAHWYMRGGRACCSNCDVKSLWESDWDGCKNHEREFVSAKSDYCPHCGAKMDG